MASQNITQLRRVVFRKWDATSSKFKTFTLEPDDLGNDTILTVNIAPKTSTRESSLGTAETPMTGTLDNFSASLTFIADNFSIMGQALNSWNAATYQGAGVGSGNILGDDSALCHQNYMSVVVQGYCDDGSSTDVELTRCIPAIDDDIELGTSDSTSITLNLHPIVYNSKTHAGDGYPEYSYRFGDNSLTSKQRLNASTGEYVDVTE